jgi:hypothetical protein
LDADGPLPAKVVFANLRAEIDRVAVHQDKFLAVDKKVGALFARMPKQVDLLEAADARLSMPSEYLSALQNEVVLFRKVDVIKPTKIDAKTLQDICDDLESKVLTADPKIKEGKPYLVKVVVNTRGNRSPFCGKTGAAETFDGC